MLTYWHLDANSLVINRLIQHTLSSMAMAMLARALSLRRANQRAIALRQAAGDSFTEYGAEISPEQSAIHSSRVSQSIDALYVLSCLREGLCLADTFASDEDCGTRLACCRPSDVEKLTISSQSLSEHARSSDAWDHFSSSLSTSSGSESIELSGKDAVRCCSNCSSSILEKREDFCLVFNTEHLVSCPSPPSAIASDCCGFLMSRKSNHNEDEARGIARRDQRDKLAENVQRRDKLRQNNGSEDDHGSSINGKIKLQEGRKEAGDEHIVQKGAAIVALEMKKFCGGNEEEEEEDEELQRLLREGAIKAVEKKSCNPYLDFRESMVQMMISACSSRRQRKVDAVDDAKYIEDLLYCYLRLNSMELHELITQAFSDTCSDLFSMQID